MADNPGMWLFHCHVDWHAEMGMGVVFNVTGGKKNDPLPSDYGYCGDLTSALVMSSDYACTSTGEASQCDDQSYQSMQSALIVVSVLLIILILFIVVKFFTLPEKVETCLSLLFKSNRNGVPSLSSSQEDDDAL